MRESHRQTLERESLQEQSGLVRQHSRSRERRSKSTSTVFNPPKKKRKSAGHKSSPEKMATGSETALSPTVDNSKVPDVQRQKNGTRNSPTKQMRSSSEAPAPQQPTDVSSDEDADDFGLYDEQDENVFGGSLTTDPNYTSDNDPYIYSDDSESFSDSYFRPQLSDYPAVLYPRASSHGSLTFSTRDDLIGRRILAEEDTLNALPPHPFSHSPHSYQTAPLSYGSLGVPQLSDRSGSPFKVSGSIASIMEDSPVDEEQQSLLNDHPSQHFQYYGYPNNTFDNPAEMDAQYLRQTKKERRKLRKQQKAAARQRQMQMLHNQKKREQAVRERTVSEVKGRPQDETQCRDSVFAFLFVAQLVLVFALAVNSGATVIFSKDAGTWGRLTQAGTNLRKSPPATTVPNKNNTRSLLQQIADETGIPYLRKLTSPLFDTGKTISKNASLHDVLMNKNDTEELLTDDAIAPDQQESSSTSASGEHSSKKSSSGMGDSTQSNNGAPTPTTAAASSTGPNSFTIDYRNSIALLAVSGFYACILSYLSFGFMLIMSRALIQVTLVFSIILSLAWGMLGLTIDPYGMVSIIGFGSLLLTLGYTIYNWQRVPFSSTNLHTALCAMRCTSDITLLGMGSILVAFAWCVLWSMAFIGVVDTYDPDKCSHENICVFEVPLIRCLLYTFFFISFYWTNNVIKNVLRVTVASAIGTWWYYPQEISPVCSPAVGQPLVRSLTKSLGSICLGSLVSQPLQCAYILGQCFCCMSNCHREAPISEDIGDKEMLPAATSTNDVESNKIASLPASSVSSKVGIATSPTSREASSKMGRRIRCFNRWSYTYIGMYGYSFCEGGEKAIQLFEAREWMDVVRDNLIQNVLLVASVVIGGSTGSFAVLAEEVDGYFFTNLYKPITTAFIIGSVLGFVLANVLLLGVVGSAVNTILVCFAAGPFEFDRNHPRLSREMRDVWSQQVWEQL